MRILLAVLLSTSFAQAMEGEVEVQQQPRVISKTLTPYMYKRVQDIRKQIAVERKLVIEDITGKLKKSHSEENAAKIKADLTQQYCKTAQTSDNKENENNSN